MRTAIAARVAARLRERLRVPVELRSGGLGELTVLADDKVVYRGSRILYPRPSTVVARVLAALGAS